MRRAITLSGLLLCVAGAFLFGFSLTDGPRSGHDASAADLEQVRTQLAGRYYRQIPARVLKLNTVESMLAALDDPYTEYLEPFAYSELRRRTAASYTGVGVTVLPQEDGFTVSAVPPGPARAAGIRVGDRIVAIDGRSTERIALERALTRILGPAGSSVTFDVLRGRKRLRIDVERAEIQTSRVESRLLEAGGRRVGYVAVRSLSAGTTQLLVETIDRLERGGVAGFVLDLRGNPGGLLDQAVGVASLFLAEGVVVCIEGKDVPETLTVDPRSRTSTLPLAVLVDRSTASAAEVVAGALRDNGRATLVGENTYGKALVQSVEPLPNGAALKLTTARYLTPSRMDISRGGLPPHVPARDEPATSVDEVLAAAIETLALAKTP